MLSLILLVFAFCLSCIAAYSAPEPARPYSRTLAASLAFFFLACIFDTSIVAHALGGISH